MNLIKNLKIGFSKPFISFLLRKQNIFLVFMLLAVHEGVIVRVAMSELKRNWENETSFNLK